MAELTSAQIETLVRAVQVVTDFLTGHAPAEVTSLEQALQAMHDMLLAAGIPLQMAAALRQAMAAQANAAVAGNGAVDASAWVKGWLAEAQFPAQPDAPATHHDGVQALEATQLPGQPDGSTIPGPAPFDSTYRPEITGLFGQDIGLDQQAVTFRPEQAALTGDATGSGMLPPGVPPELAMLNLDGMGPGLLGGVSSGIGTGAAGQGTSGVAGGGLGVFPNLRGDTGIGSSLSAGTNSEVQGGFEPTPHPPCAIPASRSRCSVSPAPPRCWRATTATPWCWSSPSAAAAAPAPARCSGTSMAWTRPCSAAPCPAACWPSPKGR